MIGEVGVGGVYIPPILAYAVLAMFPFAALRWLAHRARLLDNVWHPALFEISLYVIALSVLFLYV